MRKTRWLLLIFSLCAGAACERVHYRNQGYVGTITRSEAALAVKMVTTGTDTVTDSAGVRLSRTGSPFALLIYFTGQGSTRLEHVDVEITGKTTKARVPVEQVRLERVVPGEGAQVAVISDLTLTHDQDYQVTVRYRYKIRSRVADGVAYGLLTRTFEHQEAWAFWERLMSV